MQHLDANVLIAWHRADHPHHHDVGRWGAELLGSDEPFGAADLAWVACFRACSSPRVFPVPSPLPTRFEFRRSVEAQHTYTPVRRDRHPAVFERLCVQHRAAGNLVNDAHLAALAIEDAPSSSASTATSAASPGCAGSTRSSGDAHASITTVRLTPP